MAVVHFDHTPEQVSFVISPIKTGHVSKITGKPVYDNLTRFRLTIRFDFQKGWQAAIGQDISPLPALSIQQARMVGASFDALAREGSMLLTILSQKVAVDEKGRVPVGNEAWTMDDLTDLCQMVQEKIQDDLDFVETEAAKL